MSQRTAEEAAHGRAKFPMFISYTTQWSSRSGTMSSLLPFVWPTHVSSPAGKSLLAADAVCRTPRLWPFMLQSPSVALLWTEDGTSVSGRVSLATVHYALSLPHKASQTSRDRALPPTPPVLTLFIDGVTFSRHVNDIDITDFEILKVKAFFWNR